MVSDNNSRRSSLDVGDDGDLLPSRDAAQDFYLKYEPCEVLGKGLSSVVRRCEHKDSGVFYAVKIMDVSDEGHTDGEGLSLREQVRREAELLRRVSDHDHIVQLVDVYESTTFVFLVFELCRRGELFDYLTDKITLTEKRVRVLMKQILEAVDHCHRLRIVHRDLKPENILLDDDFNVKLTDFGFAKQLSEGERLYDVCGTPGYLAPELLKAGMLERHECNGYGIEVDAWACGVIMYTLLVGCPPFWHRKQLKMIRSIMEGQYSFDSPEWDAVTDESKNLIRRLLTVEPEDRITIADALRHEVFHAHRESLSRGLSLTSDSILADVESLEVLDNARAVQIEVCGADAAATAAAADSVADTATTAPVVPAVASSPPTMPVTTAKAPSPRPAFNARRTLRVGLTCVRFLVRFRRLSLTPEPLSLGRARLNPYSMRMFRKVIDNNAFRVYNHWVKRGEGQNRAALFEHYPKRDLAAKARAEAEDEAAAAAAAAKAEDEAAQTTATASSLAEVVMVVQ